MDKEYVESKSVLDYIDKRIPKLIASADGTHIVSVEAISAVIAKFPTADVVEVVHCKDCKHSRSYLFGDFCCESDDVWNTVHADDCLHIVVAPEHYCSYGERKV